MPPQGFVVVSQDGRSLELDGRPFFFAGANCYYLLTRAADVGLRHECTVVLDDAAAAGLTVLRLWAFADGAEQWNALQPRPGEFDERVFRGLDWLLAAAAARGLRVLLVLTNYWPDYGGMRRYVAWARRRRGQQAGGDKAGAAEPFYDDPHCQHMFRAALAATVRRVNSLTGVAYRDDPAILGWALANEPRCSGDAACTVVPRWVHHTAAHLKLLDPFHLVTVDCEGFLGPSTPESCRHNPHSCTGSGCDFASDCGSPAVDFACCHLYPELWMPQAAEQEQLAFALDWLDCHATLSQRLGKPLVLSEFGKRCCGGGPSEPRAEGEQRRAEYYRQVLGRVLRLMEGGAGVAGSAFWMLAAPSYPDYDGFTVYFSGTASGVGDAVPDRGSTAVAIAQHAAAVAALNRRPAREPGVPVLQVEQPNPLLLLSCPAGLAPTPHIPAVGAKAAATPLNCPRCACM